MEFNTHIFTLIFLPMVYVLAAIFPAHVGSILLIASLIFYGWNSILAAILLIISALFVHYLRRHGSTTYKIFGAVILAIPFLFFRTSHKLILLIPSLSDLQQLYPEALILPAGISFYTFQLIGYLFDKTPTNTIPESLLFTCFFPQLIAGPIVRFQEVIHQLHGKAFGKVDWVKIWLGLIIFSIGLSKKVFLADDVAQHATPIFDKADAGATLTFLEAWFGSIAYSFQIYFI